MRVRTARFWIGGAALAAALAFAPSAGLAQVTAVTSAPAGAIAAPNPNAMPEIVDDKLVNGLPGPDALYDLDEPELEALLAEPPPREVVLPGFGLPWAAERQAFKKWLFDTYGLTYVLSYSQLTQYATSTLPGVDRNVAVGGFAGASVTWTPIDRGGPFEGSFVMSLGWRGPLGGNPNPAPFGTNFLGLAWSNYTFTSWKAQTKIENFFWDQKIGGDLILRFGNQGPQAVLNTFRFKNGTTQFTASPVEFGETIPYPTFGAGFSFRWRPSAYPGFWINGNVNSLNGNPSQGSLNWKNLEWNQLFTGVEIGKQWRHDDGEYDQLALDVFHAGIRSWAGPDVLPNSPGWGFKILGEKQWGQIVVFANYTYNEARGGGIANTFFGNTAAAGLAYLRPFGIRGEVAFAALWTEPFYNIRPGSGQRDQYGIDASWNMALTENSTLTPDLQLIEHPSFNPKVNFVAIPGVKFRVAF